MSQDLERDAKRKAFKELLELASGILGENLKAKSPKFAKKKVLVPKASDDDCEDCKGGDCDVHDSGDDAKSKLMELYADLGE